MHPFDRYVGSRSCYVHMPFCARVCPYCDFAVVAGMDHLIPRYGAAVVDEIRRDDPWGPLESVYLGGGTPSHVPPHLLAAVLEALAETHGLSDGAEISLEANPEDFTPDRARDLWRAGFNRVSFGAQSFDPVVLDYLGRLHDPAAIRNAVESAKDAGFERVSVDLIYGSPGESGDSWDWSVRSAIALGVGHVSCYALTVERGTPLGRAVAAGAMAPDPDVQADRYETADSLLNAAGLGRYEVSNWAVPGQECTYNLTVWAGGEYLAYGNGAHGHRDRVRFRNLRRVEAYLTAVESGSRPRAGEDSMSGWEVEIDRLFVGLRRAVGVAHGPGTRALLADPEGRLLVSAGVIEDTGDRLVVRRPLLTDAVHRAVLGLEEVQHAG